MSFVTQIGSKQYLVDYNYEFVVDNLNLEADQTIELPVVFSLDKDNKEKTVTARVVDNTLGKKIRVVRFHNKTTYHKVRGFRARQTVLEIVRPTTKVASKKVETSETIETEVVEAKNAPKPKAPKAEAAPKSKKSEK